MPTTYATAFAAHHAQDFTLRPRDTTFRPRDTMVHHPTMLRPRDTTFRRGDTMVRHQPTTTKPAETLTHAPHAPLSTRGSHIPLDRRTFLQWLSRWWRGQHESGSPSFSIIRLYVGVVIFVAGFVPNFNLPSRV